MTPGFVARRLLVPLLPYLLESHVCGFALLPRETSAGSYEPQHWSASASIQPHPNAAFVAWEKGITSALIFQHGGFATGASAPFSPLRPRMAIQRYERRPMQRPVSPAEVLDSSTYFYALK